MNHTQHVRFQFLVQNSEKGDELLNNLRNYISKNNNTSIEVCEDFSLEGEVMKGRLTLLRTEDPLYDIFRMALKSLIPEDQRFAEVIKKDGSVYVIHSESGKFSWHQASLVKMEGQIPPYTSPPSEKVQVIEKLKNQYGWSPCCDTPELTYISSNVYVCDLKISEHNGELFAQIVDTESDGGEYISCLRCGTRNTDIAFDIDIL